jgi:hypothetical protein
MRVQQIAMEKFLAACCYLSQEDTFLRAVNCCLPGCTLAQEISVRPVRTPMLSGIIPKEISLSRATAAGLPFNI